MYPAGEYRQNRLSSNDLQQKEEFSAVARPPGGTQVSTQEEFPTTKEMEGDDKGIVCVTGGTGFVAPWLIMKLLEHDYIVRTTIRSSNPARKTLATSQTCPKSSNRYGASYMISKTLTEKATLEFAEKHGLDFVTILDKEDKYKYLARIQMVHIDDVTNAHIFLLEHLDADGRYLCSAIDITIDKMCETLSSRYPEYPIATSCLERNRMFHNFFDDLLTSRQRSCWILGSSLSTTLKKCTMKQFDAAKRRVFSRVLKLSVRFIILFVLCNCYVVGELYLD
ncbi:unnamed protein product [Camellia sinensis]